MAKAIINAKIYDFENFFENGFVIFDEKIIDIGDMSQFINNDYEILDGKDMMVMPSLVCGHSHIYSTFARGMSITFDPKDFQDILDQLWWKLDKEIDNIMTYYSGIVSAVDLMKNGVTTIIDHHASGSDITNSLESLRKAVVTDAGLRGAFAFEVSDRFPINEAIEENRIFYEENQTKKTRGLFGLHAGMSLSETTLKLVKKSLTNAPIHIHAAESELDEFDSLKKYNERIIHRLNRHGLIHPNSIIAHAIYLDDDELQILKEKHAVIVVNFSSNMNNAVGIPNLKRFRENGVRVIIGNDGISSSMTTEYLMIYYQTHLFDQKPQTFGLNDLKKMIDDTYSYANDLFGINIGRIKKGYDADLLMIPYIEPTPISSKNAFGHLFFGMFNSFKPMHVFVGGKFVVHNYQVSPKLNTLYQEAKHQAKKLWNKVNKEVD
ncbi:MAG: amidohydrolase [Tenericutes bacterium HGW-Tenericutes-2]|jgi:cytosine/adenosine deaminase-related metal-dependent hydrolase|nr:MAG: amidohydrolase [Tenericutes bacterium HGW-Tenericutes-2]